MTRRLLLLAGFASALLPVRGADAVGEPESPVVLDPRTGKTIRWRDLPGRLAGANAIFLGEEHDDPETHRVEAQILEAVYKKVGDRLTLSMEMLERDGQAGVNEYLAGRMDEATFAKTVRLWPNYPGDYRPMVEFAKEKKIPVLAANAPRKLVSRVGKDGLAATLAALTADEKAQIAATVTAPDGDEYATRFAAVIGPGHGDGTTMAPEMVRRFYEAQCLRDDTMADTIAGAVRNGRVVVHVNGCFHSDAGLGTAARLLWRCPLEARIAVLKIVPYKGKMSWDVLQGEADYLIFVPDRRPENKEKA